MNLFKRDMDQKAAIENIRKILIGIGQPNFDQGTGLQKKAGITNITLKDDDISNIASSLPADLQERFLELNIRTTILKFTLPDGDYVAKIELNKFSVERTAQYKTAKIYEKFPKEEIEVVLNDSDNDTVVVKSMIEKFIQEDVELFHARKDYGYETTDTVMGIGNDGAYCLDREFAWLLIGFLGKQLNFVRVSEANTLLDIFMVEHKPVRFENLEQIMRLEMKQTFNILKEQGHDVDNELESNDMDNFIYYVEKGDIQGNVQISQNNMFLVARNVKTDVIKVWNTMSINPDISEVIELYSDVNKSDESVFNVASYLHRFIDKNHSHIYDYPFEFNKSGYRKSVDFLLTHFDTETDGLIYDSEQGYFPDKYFYFNSLSYDVTYSNELLTSKYDVEKDILNLSSIDTDSPDYFFRGMMSNLSTKRSDALFYLFMVGHYIIGWNGKTFTDNENILKDHPDCDGVHDYSPFTVDDLFLFGSGSLIFNLPKDLTEPWKKVVSELVFYVQEWLNERPNNVAAQAYGKQLEQVFVEYNDNSVVQFIQSQRAK